jgi:hypothetical protein
MRPKQFVVVLDNQGRAIWVSKVFANQTLCGLLDPSCPSWRRDIFTQVFPERVAHHAADLQIYQSESPEFTNFRENIKTAITVAKDIAPEVMAIIGLLA